MNFYTSQNIHYLKDYILHRKYIFIGIILLFIIALLSFLIIGTSKKTQNKIVNSRISKVWHVTFSYDTQNGQVKVRKVVVGKGVAVKTPFTFSPYVLKIKNSLQQSLFETNVTITEGMVYNTYINPSASGSAKIDSPSLPPTIETRITVPYFDSASSIELFRDKIKILEFRPVKSTSFKVVKEANAAPFSEACGPVNIVFLSEGYQDMNKYRTDVQKVKQVLLSTEPYASNPTALDLSRIIENPSSNPLGCIQGGRLYTQCVVDPNTVNQKVVPLIFEKFPELIDNADYLKIIVLANAPAELKGESYKILGVVSGIGGFMSTFTTLPDQFVTESIIQNTEIHEIGGHAIGRLFDRYVYNSSNSNLTATQISNTRQSIISEPSNCSPNPLGEPFWTTIGISQGYQKCHLEDMYAPEPQACRDQFGNMTDRGNPNSVMSGGECGKNLFDRTEQAFIRTQIIPRYLKQCSLQPSNTPSPVSQESTPTLPQARSFKIKGTVILRSPAGNESSCPANTMRIDLDGPTTKTIIIPSDGTFDFSNLISGTYTVTLRYIANATFITTQPVTLSDSNPEATVSFFLAACFVSPGISPTPTGISGPTEIITRSPTPLPSPQGSGRGGSNRGAAAPQPEEEVALYDCRPVTDSQIVNGKTVQISRLQCDPVAP